MEKCRDYGLEIVTKVIADACNIDTVKFGNKVFNRIKMGDPGDPFEGEDPDTRCGDCGAKMGHFHHWGCDIEACPSCGGQLISCDCFWDYIEN